MGMDRGHQDTGLVKGGLRCRFGEREGVAGELNKVVMVTVVVVVVNSVLCTVHSVQRQGLLPLLSNAGLASPDVGKIRSPEPKKCQ
jgi:hypothetical protein